MRTGFSMSRQASLRWRLPAALIAGLLGVVAVVTPVAATSPNPGGINFTLPIGFQVSGKITNAANVGVGGIGVGICTGDPNNCAGMVQTAADGTYTIRGVVAGSYYAFAIGETQRNYLNTWYAGASSVTDPTRATTFTVSGNVTGINITLVSGFTVAGTVTNGSVPAPNVEVDIDGYTGGGSARTDASGHYVVGGLNPGFYTTFVRPPVGSIYMAGYVSGGTVVEGFSGDQFQVSGNVTGNNVTLVSGNTLSGHLTGLSRPATVTAINDFSGYSIDVAANGDFAIPALWPDVQVQLIVNEKPSNPGDGQFPLGVYDGTSILNLDQSTAVNIDMSGGDVTGLNLTVPGRSSLQGHITGADALPVMGTATLCGPGGCGFETIGQGGAYAFWNLPDGSYSMYVSTMDHESGYVTATGVSPNQSDADPITIAGADVIRDVAIPAGYSISGRVTGPAGEPVASASVTASDTTGAIGGGAQTDANGYYTIHGLLPGDFNVSAGSPDGSAYVPGQYYWTLSGTTADYASAGVVTVPATATFITGTNPANAATSVSKSVVATVQFSDAVLGVSGTTVWLHALGSTKPIAATVTYDSVHHVASLTPKARLHGKTVYVLEVSGVTDTASVALQALSVQFTTSK